MTVGILALQGDFAAHEKAAQAAGLKARLIKDVVDLHGLTGLILPGGESTTQLKLLRERGLWQKLDDLVKSGIKVFTTCAGTILAAETTTNPEQPSFGWLPITVSRNAYGDQRFSFEAGATFADKRLRLVFIRAPQITALDKSKVKTHLQVNALPVLVEYKNIFAATFHPELTGDTTLYHYWFKTEKLNEHVHV